VADKSGGLAAQADQLESNGSHSNILSKSLWKMISPQRRRGRREKTPSVSLCLCGGLF